MSYRFTFELTLRLAETDYKRISPPGDDCPICLDASGDDWIRIACTHSFHRHCIERVDSRKCPLCRKPIQAESSECSIL